MAGVEETRPLVVWATTVGAKMTLRPPPGVWTARGTALLLAVLVVPTAAVVALGARGGALDTLLAARPVLLGASALVAAALLLGHGRLADHAGSRALGATAGVLALASLASGGQALLTPDAPGPARALAVATAAVAAAALLLVLARALSGRVHPLVLGVPVAVLVAAAPPLASTVSAETFDGALLAVCAAFCLATAALVVLVQHDTELPRWVRDRGAVGLLLVAGGDLLACVGGYAAASVALALALAGGLLVASTAAAWLRHLVAEREQQVQDLQRRLWRAEQEHHLDRARLHDISTAIASIVTAHEAVRDLPQSSYRTGLETLLAAELGRLQRLVADPGQSPSAGRARTDVRLGQLLDRVAMAHRLQGRSVSASGSDVVLGVVLGVDADDLTRLLDLLVENAAQHGSPDAIVLAATPVAGGVEVSVTDHGPGVPAELRAELFEWGRRGVRSRGSGIGLASARELATRLGGRLSLAETDTGARFVLSLPLPHGPAAPAPQGGLLVAPG